MIICVMLLSFKINVDDVHLAATAPNLKAKLSPSAFDAPPSAWCDTVRFVLQGEKDQVDDALKAIRKGTKKSSDVNVSVSPAQVDSNLKTFTAVGWTSVSRHISHPYNLVFDLRRDNTTINKDEAKAIWLDICRKTVQGEDTGKCDKNDD